MFEKREERNYGSQRARRKGRIARLVETSRHWRSSGVLTLPKPVCTTPQRVGMRSSLQGKRARLAGELHFPIRARHGSRDGQTVIVESEIQSINAPKVTKWCGRSAECKSNLCKLPRDLCVLVASRKGLRGLRKLRGQVSSLFSQVNRIGRRPKSAGKLLCELRRISKRSFPQGIGWLSD